MINIAEKIFHTTLFLLRLDKPNLFNSVRKTFTLHRLAEKDIGIVASCYRSRELIKERLEAGYTAYWLEDKQRCVHVHWYAINEFYVWDIRCKICIPIESCYVFDVFTDPGFRKQGLFGGALAGSIVKKRLTSDGSLFALTQHYNAAANISFSRLGFVKVAELSLIQIPPIRRYSIKKNSLKETRLKIIRVRNKPLCLDLDAVRIVK